MLVGDFHHRIALCTVRGRRDSLDRRTWLQPRFEEARLEPMAMHRLSSPKQGDHQEEEEFGYDRGKDERT